MNFNVLPTVSFTPTADSFPFQPKRLSLSDKVRVLLAPQTTTPPSSSNGVFPQGSLSLGTPHAEVWIQGKQILIRDRGSTFGTYVNGIRIENQTLLQDGDIVILGRQLSRSPTTPSNITDTHLKPIEATVTIVGV
ncbi:hypothetical protein HYDPIDRAFT_91601 [Hydnomerulius pinastri MD-312]|uniref:FHA domain-containing protein n=1 Tax=Hydnomerulius pinastri MD-312 TaxID=994086 RepID=A0A0C9W8H7_9AGAM|nr:hypothetical protein HYDPIDRAFT_91601 [Hydnomerulius pinastri MD-312]